MVFGVKPADPVVRQNKIAQSILTFQSLRREESGDMLAILLGLFRLIWLFGRSQDAVALENLALRVRSPMTIS